MHLRCCAQGLALLFALLLDSLLALPNSQVLFVNNVASKDPTDIVVTCCIFAEICRAKKYCCDIILHAVSKSRMWAITGSLVMGWEDGVLAA